MFFSFHTQFECDAPTIPNGDGTAPGTVLRVTGIISITALLLRHQSTTQQDVTFRTLTSPHVIRLHNDCTHASRSKLSHAQAPSSPECQLTATSYQPFHSFLRRYQLGIVYCAEIRLLLWPWPPDQSQSRDDGTTHTVPETATVWATYHHHRTDGRTGSFQNGTNGTVFHPYLD